jgi:hypothetical protein
MCNKEFGCVLVIVFILGFVLTKLIMFLLQ